MNTLILNLTEGSFIRVDGILTQEYNQKMKELITPDVESGLSHWSRQDKIVIVPTHLNAYVEKNYGEIYVYTSVKVVRHNMLEEPNIDAKLDAELIKQVLGGDAIANKC